MEIYKQITKDIDVVSIASFQELKFNFWKDDNKEYLESEKYQKDIEIQQRIR